MYLEKKNKTPKVGLPIYKGTISFPNKVIVTITEGFHSIIQSQIDLLPPKNRYCIFI